MTRPVVRYHLPALAWALLIAVLLLTPADPELKREMSFGWLVGLRSFWVDVAAHFAVFGVLGWLAVRSFGDLGVRRPLLAAILGAVGYGVLLELGQELVPGRGFEALDVLVNGVGAALGGRLADRA